MLVAIFNLSGFALFTSVKYQICFLLFLTLGCQTFKESPLLVLQEDSVTYKVDTAGFPYSSLLSREAVKHFYANRDFQLFWSSAGKIKPAADSLLWIVAHANRYGLIGEDYHAGDLDKLLLDTLASDRLPRVDLMLTDAYLTFYEHLQNGRLDSKTMQRRDLSLSVDHEAVAALKEADKIEHVRDLEMLEPGITQYQELKNALGELLRAGKEKDSVLAKRAEMISLNMERWRWQNPWPRRYVYVNIPSFIMRAVEQDSVWLESRIIVGKRETPTPVMESVIRSFIIYPYWHAPYSISTKEILPALQRDASYLRRNNFEVLNRKGKIILSDTIQWDFYSANNFPFILRQREGSENSMGIIKFVFANNYNVYLHDTNSKRLYERNRRDLSHGCVRVDRAVAFAHYLVREDDIYVSPEDLDQYLSLQQRLKIDLRKPIALKMEYFTAEVKDGVPFFYEDIYKKDSVMMQALIPSNPSGDLEGKIDLASGAH